MTSLVDRHLYPIFMLPSKMLAKFRGWVYGYIRLLLGMVCSVSCIFCVFTFIWYLTFRGLYGFLINLQLYQPPTGSDDDSDLTIEYTDYQSGKRGSFLTRCRAQAELIQQSLKKSRTNGDKSPNGHSVKLNSGDIVTSENNSNSHHHHRCHNHNHHHSPNKESSSHGQLLVRNSSYVSEMYYDENGHKIGEQIYLTNDSDGLEESYFQFKVNDYQHLKELGGLSTSVLVEEEPFDDVGTQQQIQQQQQQPQQNGEPDVEMVPIADPVDKNGAIGGINFEDKTIDDNNTAMKQRKVSHIHPSHSPESTTSYCGSSLIDEPTNTYEDDCSAKTVTINNTIITCSTTNILKPKNEPINIKPEFDQGKDSSNNNNPENNCSTIQSNSEYSIESVKNEETKEPTLNNLDKLEPSTDNNTNSDNDKPNDIQLNGKRRSKQTTNGDTKSKSINGIDKSQNELIKDQAPNPSLKRKRKRRNNYMNNNNNRSKNS